MSFFSYTAHMLHNLGYESEACLTWNLHRLHKSSVETFANDAYEQLNIAA